MRRSLARATLIAEVMHADGRVDAKEVFAGDDLVKRRTSTDNRARRGDWVEAMNRTHSIDSAIATLCREWKMEREDVVRDLWEMARSDGELHADEVELIERIAEELGVKAEMVR